MSEERPFDKPAQVIVVDLINHSNRTQFHYDELEIEGVSEEPATSIPYRLIPKAERYRTTVTVRDVQSGARVGLHYFRLDLPTYLYRDLLTPEELEEPGVLTDRYATTVDTAAEDALAYINSSYGVQLLPQDVEIVSQPLQRRVDGSWPVSVAVRRTHPVWVGAVELDAYENAV